MATRAAVIKKIKANPNETLLKMPEDELSDLVLYFNNQYFVKGKSSISDELTSSKSSNITEKPKSRSGPKSSVSESHSSVVYTDADE